MPNNNSSHSGDLRQQVNNNDAGVLPGLSCNHKPRIACNSAVEARGSGNLFPSSLQPHMIMIII